VLLLRNEDQEHSNPLASSQPVCWQRSDLRTCAKRVGGLAVTTLPWWASRSFIRPYLHG